MPIEPTYLINELIHEWLYTTLGYNPENVFKSDQNGPPITDGSDFITFQILAEDSDENAYFEKELIRTNEDPNPPEYDYNNLLNIYTKRVMAIVTVQIWSPIAREQHRKLNLSRNLKATRDIFSPYNSAFVMSDSSTYNIHVGDTERVNRVEARYTIATNSQLTEQNERVHEFEISGELQKG